MRLFSHCCNKHLQCSNCRIPVLQRSFPTVAKIRLTKISYFTCPHSGRDLRRSTRIFLFVLAVQICFHNNDRFVQGFEFTFDAFNAVDGD